MLQYSCSSRNRNNSNNDANRGNNSIISIEKGYSGNYTMQRHDDDDDDNNNNNAMMIDNDC